MILEKMQKDSKKFNKILNNQLQKKNMIKYAKKLLEELI